MVKSEVTTSNVFKEFKNPMTLPFNLLNLDSTKSETESNEGNVRSPTSNSSISVCDSSAETISINFLKAKSVVSDFTTCISFETLVIFSVIKLVVKEN